MNNFNNGQNYYPNGGQPQPRQPQYGQPQYGQPQYGQQYGGAPANPQQNPPHSYYGNANPNAPHRANYYNQNAYARPNIYAQELEAPVKEFDYSNYTSSNGDDEPGCLVGTKTTKEEREEGRKHAKTCKIFGIITLISAICCSGGVAIVPFILSRVFGKMSANRLLYENDDASDGRKYTNIALVICIVEIVIGAFCMFVLPYLIHGNPQPI